MSLRKTLYPQLSTGWIQPRNHMDMTEKSLTGFVSINTKQTKPYLVSGNFNKCN